MTHLSEAKDVLLRGEWEKHLVPITSLPLQWIRLFRPSTLDLILTKMMRGDDAQDMQDIAFLTEQEKITSDQLEDAFADAVIPNLVEYRDAFNLAKRRVLEMAK